MKMSKKQMMATIGALGLTAGALAGCSGQNTNTLDDDDLVEVVNSEGETMYIEEDEFEDNGGVNGGMFMLMSGWNGSNHSNLKSSEGYKGSTYTSKASAKSSTSKSNSGVGKSSSGKSSGFGG